MQLGMIGLGRIIYPCLCGWLNAHKKPVGVRLLSLPNIKNGSPVHCWTALTSILKFHAWTMKKLSGDRLRKTSEIYSSQSTNCPQYST